MWLSIWIIVAIVRVLGYSLNDDTADATSPTSSSFRALRVTDESDCDLPCIQREFEKIIQTEDGSVYLPSILEQYFGNRIRMKVNRLMSAMGLDGGADEILTNVKTELSPNQMQLRVVGYTLDNSVGRNFNLDLTEANGGRVRVENIYTLEEQGYVGVAIGVLFSNAGTEKSAPDIQVSNALDQLSFGMVKLPRFLNFLSNWTMLEMGILGDTRSHIENNPRLQRYAAHHTGFKQVAQIQRLMDNMNGFNDQLNSIRLVSRVKLPLDFKLPFTEGASSDGDPIAANTFTSPFNCSIMPPGIPRKMCRKATRFAKFRVNYNFDGVGRRNGGGGAEWEPYIDVEIDTGFGDTGISNFINSFSNGKSLDIGIEDFNLGENTEVADPRFRVAWAPLSKNPLQFGIFGQIARRMFGETFHFMSELMFPITGAIGVSLFSPGVQRLMWPLPIWVGNLRGHGELLQGILPIAGLLGGDINIGFPPQSIMLENGTVIEEDTRIKSVSTVSFDPASLTKSFVYSKLSPVTIQTLLNLWVGHKRHQLPPFIAESGIKGISERFGRVKKKNLWTEDGQERAVLHAPRIPENPEQFLMTFSPFGVSTQALPDVDGISILQPGLTVLGQSGLLGVAAKTFGRMDFTHLGADLDMALDAVNLGQGLIKLSAANVTTKRDIPEFMENVGPRVYSSFQALPSRMRPLASIPEFRISAAVDIFGVRFGIDVGVSPYGFHFKTELDVWGWFIAKCLIEVQSYNKGLKNGVRVYGELTINSLRKLARGFFQGVIHKIGELFQVPRMVRAWKQWRRVKNAKRNFKAWRRDGRKRRRFFRALGKFRASMKRAGQKLKPITQVQLIRVKFDLNNASPDRSFPVFTEFKFTLFGKHFVRYKRHEQAYRFDQPLRTDEIEEIANDIVMDVEDCVEHCDFDDDACLGRVAVCQSRRYAHEPAKRRPKAFIDRDERKVLFFPPDNFVDRDMDAATVESVPVADDDASVVQDDATVETYDVPAFNWTDPPLPFESYTSDSDSSSDDCSDGYSSGYEFIDRQHDERYVGREFVDRDFVGHQQQEGDPESSEKDTTGSSMNDDSGLSGFESAVSHFSSSE